jgi:ATP-dependent RNA helicase DeaD
MEKIIKTIANFSELNLPAVLTEGLEAMGFKIPTPIQAAGIPAALAGKDVLGIAPTGTGKTGAFGIPAIANLTTQKEKQVLIIAPTRELAAQIFKFMTQMGDKLKLKGALLVGGEPFRRQAADCDAGADYLVATPGRLMDHMKRGLDLRHVGILILDEVDRMLDMGFAPQIEHIVERTPSERQTLFFSATMPPVIQKLVQRFLKDPVSISVGQNAADAPKIREEKIKVSKMEKFPALLEQLKIREGKALVFMRTQGGAEQIVSRLEHAGIMAACIHGGRSQEERKRGLEAFRQNKVRILVATDIVARGIDVPEIEIVINYDYPATKEDYLHRIGRTGRCGKEGVAISFIEAFGSSNPRFAPARRSPREPAPPFSRLPNEQANRDRPRLGVQSRTIGPVRKLTPTSPVKRERPKLPPREARSGISGTVTYFRAGDAPVPKRVPQGEISLPLLKAKPAPVPAVAPDWIRTEKNTVRRNKYPKGT